MIPADLVVCVVSAYDRSITIAKNSHTLSRLLFSYQNGLWSKETYDLIDYCSKHEPEIAAWCDDGIHFIVRNKAAIERKLEIQYTTFVRKLNYHGFQNVSSRVHPLGKSRPLGEEYWYHDFFRKDQLELLDQVHCTGGSSQKRKGRKDLLEISVLKDDIEEKENMIRMLQEELIKMNDECMRLQKELIASYEKKTSPEELALTPQEQTDDSMEGLSFSQEESWFLYEHYDLDDIEPLFLSLGDL